MEAESRELHRLLEQGLGQLGVEGNPEPWARLALLIERWGRRLNLTGHPDARAVASRLLLEAAALSRRLPSAASIADLGSGAGIPGLPIALCRPETRVWLIESRERRHHFQRAAIREMGLANVEALHGRAEALEPRPSEGVISQAFAQAELAVSWMRPWMADGAWLALATTPDFPGIRDPQLAPGELLPYSAPGGPQRALWLTRAQPQAGAARSR